MKLQLNVPVNLDSHPVFNALNTGNAGRNTCSAESSKALGQKFAAELGVETVVSYDVAHDYLEVRSDDPVLEELAVMTMNDWCGGYH
tara:strand:- start:1839 stop:2099 length:261 start_codon:yes stop_codon:yes gene_type:complete